MTVESWVFEYACCMWVRCAIMQKRRCGENTVSRTGDTKNWRYEGLAVRRNGGTRDWRYAELAVRGTGGTRNWRYAELVQRRRYAELVQRRNCQYAELAQTRNLLRSQPANATAHARTHVTRAHMSSPVRTRRRIVHISPTRLLVPALRVLHCTYSL